MHNDIKKKLRVIDMQNCLQTTASPRTKGIAIGRRTELYFCLEVEFISGEGNYKSQTGSEPGLSDCVK